MRKAQRSAKLNVQCGLSAPLPWRFTIILEEKDNKDLALGFLSTTFLTPVALPPPSADTMNTLGRQHQHKSVLECECHMTWVGGMLKKKELHVQEQHRLVGPGEEASLNFWFQPDATFPAREFQASPSTSLDTEANPRVLQCTSQASDLSHQLACYRWVGLCELLGHDL